MRRLLVFRTGNAKEQRLGGFLFDMLGVKNLISDPQGECESHVSHVSYFDHMGVLQWNNLLCWGEMPKKMDVHPLKLTANASEIRPSPKGNSFFNH